MNSMLSKKVLKIFAGFSVVGGVTTLLSLAALYVFLELFKTALIPTYAIIYFLTILLSYYANSVFVFKSTVEVKKTISYFCIYLSGMVVGMLLLWVFKATIPLDDYLLSYFVLPLTMAWNFLLSFRLFKH